MVETPKGGALTSGESSFDPAIPLDQVYTSQPVMQPTAPNQDDPFWKKKAQEFHSLEDARKGINGSAPVILWLYATLQISVGPTAFRPKLRKLRSSATSVPKFRFPPVPPPPLRPYRKREREPAHLLGFLRKSTTHKLEKKRKQMMIARGFCLFFYIAGNTRNQRLQRTR